MNTSWLTGRMMRNEYKAGVKLERALYHPQITLYQRGFTVYPRLGRTIKSLLLLQ
ncbi:hypothetical protein VIM7927_01669 [Vibrio mangrovi]|uniref:Uncharacterized protein n=2 Tax=Vibrio mangrovi TaxID=474394 RepID=A0A1Y6IS09_9VIBR|nr:hypothetical protein VIM7927_01669 [Vibrio mangrovi]